MRSNTYKTVIEEPEVTEKKERKKPSIFSRMPKWKLLSTDAEDENSQYIQKLIFVTFLGIIYIANSFQAEKSHLRINRLEKSVEMMRVEYSTLKYDFINESKRSKVEEKVLQKGLIPLETAPIVITVPNLEDN